MALDESRRKEYEERLSRAIAAVFTGHKNSLSRTLGNPPSLSNLPPEFWQAYGFDLSNGIQPYFERSLISSAMAMVEDYNLQVDTDVINQEAANFARRYAFDLVTDIVENDQHTLSVLVQNYFEKGWTMGELTEKITGDVYGPARAEMIAVTEVTRAATQGELAIAGDVRRQGIDMVPIWETNNDEMVCEICGDPNRVGKPITDGLYPPAHPRCRCWVNHVLPGMVDDEGGEPEPEEVEIQPGQVHPCEWSELKQEDMIERENAWMMNAPPENPRALGDSSAWKDQVCRDLAQETGLQYEKINNFIHQWAITSNDTDMRSLQIQQMATKIFGGELSPFQIERISIALAREGADSVPLSFYSQTGMAVNSDDAVQTLLQTMYKNTQKELDKLGVDELLLFRGTEVPRAMFPNIAAGDIIELSDNALASWSSRLNTAKMFGDYDEQHTKVILKAVIPKGGIVGTPHTGFGCLDEFEYVIMGNRPMIVEVLETYNPYVD